MELTSAYNCVYASIYNYLKYAQGFDFDFFALGALPGFFDINAVNGRLVSQRPEENVCQFLDGLNAHLVFDDIKSTHNIKNYLHKRLIQDRVVPAAINLRFSVLDPTRFDNDYWNFQIICKALDNDEYEMFDPFHGKYYSVTAQHLCNMVDTDFNYRFGGQFTPFPSVAFDNIDKAREKTKVFDTISQIESVLLSYNREKNLAGVRNSFQQLRDRYLNGSDQYNMHNEIYQLMGFLILVVKSREFFAEHCSSLIDKDSEISSLANTWQSLMKIFPVSIGRRDRQTYNNLEQRMLEIIDKETDIINRALSTLTKDRSINTSLTNESNQSLETL